MGIVIWCVKGNVTGGYGTWGFYYFDVRESTGPNEFKKGEYPFKNKKRERVWRTERLDIEKYKNDKN